MYGQVVGINTAKIVSSGYEGMGFAIPIKTAQSIVNDLKSQGYVSGRVRLGITGQSVTQSMAQTYQCPQGVMIRDISSDSSFKNTDAQKGDIITKVNGTAVTNLDTLYTEMAKYKPGDTVTVTLYRGAGQQKGSNNTFDVKVTLLEDRGETQQTVSQPDTTNPFQP
jgi:serine protease Do